MSKHTPDDPIMRVLEYTTDDVDANRAGRLGAWQRARIERRRRQYLISGILMTGLFLAIDYIIAWRPDAMATQPGIAIFVAIFPLLTAVITGVMVTLLNRDLSAGRVERASGPITRASSSGYGGYHPATGRHLRSRTRYTIQVGDKRFSVPGKTFSAFRGAEHVSYAVYYLPRTKIIVGAEQIEREP
jgi:hypothetical protein